MKYYSTLKKKWTIDKCYKMDEPQKHYVKWSKLGTKDLEKYNVIFHEYNIIII